MKVEHDRLLAATADGVVVATRSASGRPEETRTLTGHDVTGIKGLAGRVRQALIGDAAGAAADLGADGLGGP